MPATTPWRLKGPYLKNCSCAPGCPCDFWAAPTRTFCEGMIAMRIEEGHFGDLSLSGLHFGATYHWPGPLHLGNGTMLPLVDVRATEAQRNALLTIMSGQAGNAWFEVIASVVSTVHDPQFVPFEFEFDLAARKARCVVPGILDTVSQPVLNEATGQAHSVQVCMPQGMEYKKCEIAHAAINKGAGKIAYDHPMSHSSLALVDQTHQGLRS